MTRSTRYIGLLFTALALIWGLSFVAIKTGLDGVPPVLLAAVRHDIAAVVLFAYAVWQGRSLRPRTRDDWSLILIGGTVLIGAHYALLFLGQQYVPSSFGAILLSLTPVVTPAFASTLLPSYRVRPHELIGTVCGFIGVVIIANPTPGAVGGRLLGVTLLIGSAVAFAVGAVLTERYHSSLSLVSLQSWMTLLGAAILHGVSIGLPSERLASVSVGVEQVAAIAYLGIGASAVGFLLYFRLVSTVGAAETSLVSYAVPAVTALSGWLLLGETLGPVTVAGFAVIIVGFAWVKADVLLSLRRRRAGAPSSQRCGPQDDCVVVSGNAYATQD